MATSETTAALSRVLLAEPESLQRRTVAAVARELELANIHESTSVESALQLVCIERFDALVLALDENDVAFELITRLRAGDTVCDAAAPVAVLAAHCSAQTAMRLKELGVRRLVLKPFKVKTILEAIEALVKPAS